MTWAMNVIAPAKIAERYADSRIVVFSSGNVYPTTPVHQGGAREDTAPSPVGEYAMSCLGRERVFDYYSREHGLKCLFFRLNYALDLRYGVLHDIAENIMGGIRYPCRPPPLTVFGNRTPMRSPCADFCGAPRLPSCSMSRDRKRLRLKKQRKSWPDCWAKTYPSPAGKCPTRCSATPVNPSENTDTPLSRWIC